MNITYEQVGKRRYGDSVVYEFHILVDGEIIKDEGTGEAPSPHVYSIQVQDGCCVATALTSMLKNIKLTLEADNDSLPDLPEVTLED
jgi:hypothetical protein